MRRPKGGRRGLTWAILLLLTALGSAAGARDPDSLQAELRRTRQELNYQKKRLETVNAREADLARQLGRTQAELWEVRRSLEDLRARRAQAKARLELVNQKLRLTAKRLEQSQRVLERRLREIYEEGEVGFLVVLLGSQSVTDFLNQAEYLGHILAADRELVAEVRRRRAELETRRAAALRTVEEIRSLQQAYRKKAAALKRLERRRSHLLAQVRAQRRALARQVVELEESSHELEARLQELLRANQGAAGSVPRSAGAYLWPVPGWLTSRFGYRIHPLRGTTLFHTGIDIAAPQGSPIRAADHGRVIHSGWYGGYGNTVILDHGGGYSTLYAHCSTLSVSVGDIVRQGQTIGSVGSTGYSTGPHLHFEVRHQGTPIDPLGRL